MPMVSELVQTGFSKAFCSQFTARACLTAKPKKTRKVGKAVDPAKSAKPIRRQAAAPAVSTSVDVRALSVDQLLSLKAEVDARLADIVKQMRAAKVAL